MLDIGFAEIGVVVIVALLVFGPERLPEIARLIGKWVTRWRRLWTNIQEEVDDPILKNEKKK